MPSPANGKLSISGAGMNTWEQGGMGATITKEQIVQFVGTEVLSREGRKLGED